MSARLCCDAHSGLCSLRACCGRCPSEHESRPALYGTAALVVLVLVLLALALPA